MYEMFHPGLPLGVDRPYVDGDEALATRVQMVLETRPGQIPWRPDFGCNLDALVGKSATRSLLNQARWEIEVAIKRWLTDVTLHSIELRVVPLLEGSGVGGSNVPVAESAILSLGAQASLELELELSGPNGPLTLTTLLEP